jgi:phage terminase large subunit GpA-like protein
VKHAFLTSVEFGMWAPPQRMTISSWADAYRIISARKGNPEPGQWRTSRTPYLREIMDAIGDPDLEEIVVMKAAQVGGSEGCARNPLAYWVDQDPGPTLFVYPTQAAAEEQIVDRIRPMILDTPKLAAHLPGARADMTAHALDFDTMAVWIGWAGSPQALASRPCRYVVLDEVDKFPPFSGREGEPIALAKARTRTFGHRKKIVIISTPTTGMGAIAKAFEACPDKRRYHVPCPSCGALQALVWSQMKWSSVKDEPLEMTIARLEAEEAAIFYECADCHAQIPESERDLLVEQGIWVSDGYPAGEHPKSRFRAYHITGLVATIGTRWRDFAVKFLKIQKDIAKLMEFVNQDLGEPFLDQIGRVETSALRAKAQRGHARGKVPRWAGILLVTVDTQKDHFYWLVRAWGRGERSRLIDLGIARSWEELERVTFGARYALEGCENELVGPAAVFIDLGGGTRPTPTGTGRTRCTAGAPATRRGGSRSRGTAPRTGARRSS